MLAFLYTVMVAVLGEDTLINPLFGIFYVLLWVGFVPLSLAFGPAYKAISPVRTINSAVREAHRQRPRPRASSPTPSGWATGRRRSASTRSCGWSWSTRSPPSSARSGCGARRTSPRCCSAAPCSAARSTSTPTRSRSTRRWSARLSVWGRRRGQLVVRSPLANLATTPVRPGLVAVTAVLFGSTAFDSFKDSTRWVKFIQGDFVAKHSWAPERRDQRRPARLRARGGAGLHASARC